MIQQHLLENRKSSEGTETHYILDYVNSKLENRKSPEGTETNVSAFGICSPFIRK